MAGKGAIKKRKKRASRVKGYNKLREELQLRGRIPVTPHDRAGARQEIVKPETQSEQPLPELTAKAIRNKWAVPDEKKPKLVDEMVNLVEDKSEQGKVRVQAFRALNLADKDQHERDNPKLDSKGTQVNVGVVTPGIDWNQLHGIERPSIDTTEERMRIMLAQQISNGSDMEGSDHEETHMRALPEESADRK